MTTDWAITILTSEFVWGVLTGLALSIAGAAIQIHLTRKAHIRLQKEDVAAISIDMVRNIMRVTEDISEARRRSRVIHSDLLILLDAETAVFGRVREQTIRLPDDLRAELRKFVIDCALRRSEIGNKIDLFNEQWKMGGEFEQKQMNEEAAAAKANANNTLSEAHRSVDELAATVTRGDSLISKLESI